MNRGVTRLGEPPCNTEHEFIYTGKHCIFYVDQVCVIRFDAACNRTVSAVPIE